jgi:hypothetical protein
VNIHQVSLCDCGAGMPRNHAAETAGTHVAVQVTHDSRSEYSVSNFEYTTMNIYITSSIYLGTLMRQKASREHVELAGWLEYSHRQ